MENTFIQYYSISISISIEIFASRVPWRWRYCKSKQCSNDNFPTSAKPSEVKENTNEQFHSLSQLQYTYIWILYVDVGPQPHQQLGHCDMAIPRCPVQRRPTILIQSNNKYTFTFTFTFTFRLEITLPTILISTNYTFTLSSNLQLQITNTINHYIANYKSRIENTTQAIAKVTTATRSNSMKTNKTLSKENIKLHEFVAMKSLIYIFSNI